ncbi:MAG TPA: hypothetical protein VF544_08145 [Pyrinomonadaceae bacterium]|jgi:hypothetical protein
MRSLILMLKEKGVELLLGGLIGFVFGIIPVIVGNSSNALLIIALVFAVLLLVYFWVRDYRRTQDNLTLGDMLAFKKVRRGVIFTLGLHSAERGSTIYLVHKALQPEYIGFLGTPQTESVVKAIVRELNLKDGTYKTEAWELTEIEEGKTKTSLVIDWMRKQGLRESEMVLDITGGTATMSVAAFIAAQERRIDCQYIQSRYDEIKNVHVEESQKPVLITNYSHVCAFDLSAGSSITHHGINSCRRRNHPN